MKIRESNQSDKASIFSLHQNSFGAAEGSTVAKLAIDLLNDETALPILSLVAESDNSIIGHILFTSVKVGNLEFGNAYILAPLAVAPKMQRKGVGTTLINYGLDKLKQRDASLVLVLGDPKYYNRTGFKAEHDIEPPYKLDYPEAWLAQELRTGAFDNVSGAIQCATSLRSPAHW